MLICPVCKYPHPEKVSNCKRCNWSIQDYSIINGISPEHPILKTCIPTLVKRLEELEKDKKILLSNMQILDPDIQKANNKKLDEILDAIENSKKQQVQETKTFKEIFIELKYLIKNKNDCSSLEQETKEKRTIVLDFQSSPTELNSLNYNNINKNNTVINDNNNSLLTESDRETNNISNMTDYSGVNKDSDQGLNAQEVSLYNETGVHVSSETINPQVNNEPEANSTDSYQNFYRLIKNRELEVTQVKIPQETMEKMRGGTQNELKFSNDRKGNYWIVNWRDVYCLIPKEKININQYQYGNFQRVFNCQNYQETYSKFEILKPATVVNYDGETWRLESKGEIKFI